MKKRVLPFFLCAFVLLFSVRAQAHPHSWIDLETTLLFDDQGRVTGLWVGWLFDDFYSAYTLEETARNEDGTFDQKDLDALAERNLTNLEEYSYFTYIRADEKQQTYKKVTDYKTFVDGHRLWMEFSVMLETPIDPVTHKVDYAVYDPTYYVEVLHALDGDPIQMVGNTNGCGYQLKKPEPPKELSLMAAALDKTETAGDGIGVSFAERVILTCS
ncbi:DUF1007 family protein [Terasakiella sp. A23]|uniref:DUF1007 family protein n=1 Tax=Terasakiella sp. FCG-A23 TaxID=3080561 RepID=UPI00295408B6|nr:DUF1007 family protein [Terasakiella sp. A23]MDV7340494.1 DUF1007 family protein [Terasakiella sp. A23]